VPARAAAHVPTVQPPTKQQPRPQQKAAPRQPPQPPQKRPRPGPPSGAGTPSGAHDSQGVVYIGHIPHGFFEAQMQKYFSQFGEVRRLALSRSRKTGRARGYAFVQFADATVARIAAEAMDGYALMEKVLVAKVVPPEKVAASTFRFAGREWRKIPWRRVVRDAQARPRSEAKASRLLARIVQREAAAGEKLKALGIEYELGTSYEAQARARYLDEEDEEEEEEEEEEEDEEGPARKKGAAAAASHKPKLSAAAAPVSAKVAAAKPAAVGGKRKR
jgi:nucleolar protein 15